MTACAGNRFPFFRAIEGWQALVVGGGGVALRKARVLVQFGARVRAVALEYAPGFSELAVERAVRAFCPSDLNGARICIAATDDRAVNVRIAQLCRARGIEVNVADDAALSTFCFPALLCRGALTAAVSTSGASPLAARWARDRIAEALPTTSARCWREWKRRGASPCGHCPMPGNAPGRCARSSPAALRSARFPRTASSRT